MRPLSSLSNCPPPCKTFACRPACSGVCNSCLIVRIRALPSPPPNATRRKGLWTWPNGYLFCACNLSAPCKRPCRSHERHPGTAAAACSPTRRRTLRILWTGAGGTGSHLSHRPHHARCGRRRHCQRQPALDCVSCSLRKGARQTAPDPQSGLPAPLYHPRQDNRHFHFRWDEVTVIGLTATGRATISALDMNRPLILAIRREEILLNRHPPPDTFGTAAPRRRGGT